MKHRHLVCAIICSSKFQFGNGTHYEYNHVGIFIGILSGVFFYMNETHLSEDLRRP